jgi:hypothetical protein
MGNICPLCSIEHEHSHFSYEIRKYFQSDYNTYAKKCDALQNKLDITIARITNWYIEFNPNMIDDLLEEIKKIK